MSDAQLKALQQFIDLMNQHSSAQVFAAAEEIGLFAALSKGQHTAEELATECGADSQALGLLLDALIDMQVLEKYDDDYALPQSLQLAYSEKRRVDSEVLGGLTEYLRTGQRQDQPSNSFAAHSAASQWMFTPMALTLSSLLGLGEERKGLRVLEIGGGAGLWGLTLAHRDPTLQLHVVDSPEAVAALQKTAKDIGASDRLTCTAGDYMKAEFTEESFDLAILAGVLHWKDEEANLSLLKNIRKALTPNGELAVIDIFPGQEEGNLTRSLHALKLALASRAGKHYLPDEMQALMMNAGFQKPQYAHLSEPPHTRGLMLSTK